jgi:beta-lactam-binding protein with PASTA domain
VITTPTTINVTAIDDQGNASVCAFTITPIDTTVPVIVNCVADQTVSANSTCEFVMLDYTALAIVDDNCDASLTITQSPIAGSTVAGTTTVTITVTDDAGNSTTCMFDVEVNDTTNPTIATCASDITVNVNASCVYTMADFRGGIVASDNCDASLVLSQSPAIGSTHTGHSTVIPVTITATDDSGNQCNS